MAVGMKEKKEKAAKVDYEQVVPKACDEAQRSFAVHNKLVSKLRQRTFSHLIGLSFA